MRRRGRRGLSLRAIARELGISRITVRKYVEASSPPVYPDRSSLLTLDHVEPPSVHNNRPVGKWAIPPGLSIYPRAAPLGSSHHHCHPRCHTKLEVGDFSIIELDNYWLDAATTDIIAGPLPLT